MCNGELYRRESNGKEVHDGRPNVSGEIQGGALKNKSNNHTMEGAHGNNEGDI